MPEHHSSTATVDNVARIMTLSLAFQTSGSEKGWHPMADTEAEFLIHVEA